MGCSVLHLGTTAFQQRVEEVGVGHRLGTAVPRAVHHRFFLESGVLSGLVKGPNMARGRVNSLFKNLQIN